jgi:hypothetical protein
VTADPHLEPRKRSGSAARAPASRPGPPASNGRGELPAGWRVWHPRDEIVRAPLLHRDAYRGPVGRYLDLLDGRTEAHPAAVGIEVLACVGTLIGRRASYRAGRITHHANLYAAVVGPSSEGAKGVADDETRELMRAVSPDFPKQHAIGGLGSGETLVRELDDARDPPSDRRRVITDAELVSVFKIVKRDGSILGDILRKAFDYGPLRHSTIGNKAAVASNHHVAVVGSITPEDLRAYLDELSIANGLGNRFLYIWSQMAALLPHGAEIDPVQLGAIADEIRAALETLAERSRPRGSLFLALNPGAKSLWSDFYRLRRTGVGTGHLKALTSRQVAHAARLAVVYAVLDRSRIITRDHVAAAIAWCDYSIETIRMAFPEPVAGRAAQLLAAIRAGAPDGLNGRQQHEVFHRHLEADELDELRAELETQHLIHTFKIPTGGRTRIQSVAISRT